MNSDNIALWKTQHNNAEEDCFKILILRETWKSREQHPEEFLCIFGSQTFVPISWMCKKQTSVSHSSTEAEVISLDAGLRMDGIPACDPWDLAIELFHSPPNQINKSRGQESQENLSRNTTLHMKNQNPTEHVNLDPNNVDHVSTKVRPSQFGAMLYVFEDIEAVIKMIIKGRTPTMRHVSRTQRVALDWLVDRINIDCKIQIRYFDTKHQLADILTKGNFTRDEWTNFLHLFNISHFSSLCCAQNFSLTSCPKTTAKRMQEQKRRRQKCGKIEIYSDEPVFTCSDKFSSAKSPIASKSPGVLTASGKPESRRRRNSRSDAASRSQARLQDAHLGGLMDTATEKPVATKEEESEYVDLSESETGWE